MINIENIVRKIISEGVRPNVVYSAVVIEEPSEIAKIQNLVEKYVPINKGWRKPYNYHMTISLGDLPESLYLKGDLNKEVTLTINSIGISNSAIALGASGYYSRNDNPHITIAFHKHSEPSASKEIKNWEPIDNISVTGTIREVGENNNIITQHYWHRDKVKKKIKNPLKEEMNVENEIRKQVRKILMEYVTYSDLKSVDSFADELFSDLGIDVEFTKHFLDRVNDPRNGKEITPEELKDLFRKEYQKYGEMISKLPPGAERVMTDIDTNINVPFVIDWDKKSPDMEMINKTVMRKKNFKSYTPKLPV